MKAIRPIRNVIEMNGRTYCQEGDFLDYVDRMINHREEKIERGHYGDADAWVYSSKAGYDLAVYLTSENEYNEFIIF